MNFIDPTLLCVNSRAAATDGSRGSTKYVAPLGTETQDDLLTRQTC